MNDHIVFFDGECGFCKKSIRFVLERDQKKQFYFAPLQGETAKKWVPEQYRKKLTTSVLVENYQGNDPKIYTYGKGAFRVLWLLGRWYKLIGWPFFLPSFLYDWGYVLIEKSRKYMPISCPVQKNKFEDRFLP